MPFKRFPVVLALTLNALLFAPGGAAAQTYCPAGYPVDCGDGYCCPGNTWCNGDGTCQPYDSGPEVDTTDDAGCPAGTYACGVDYCAPLGAECCDWVGRPDVSCANGTTCGADGNCYEQDGSAATDSGSGTCPAGSYSCGPTCIPEGTECCDYVGFPGYFCEAGGSCQSDGTCAGGSGTPMRPDSGDQGHDEASDCEDTSDDDTGEAGGCSVASTYSGAGAALPWLLALYGLASRNARRRRGALSKVGELSHVRG